MWLSHGVVQVLMPLGASLTPWLTGKVNITVLR